MCIIVDTNVFHLVFKRNSVNHKDFEPVLNWVVNGYGTLVYGGSKYDKELYNAKEYLKLFNLLKKIRKAEKAENLIVDDQEKIVEKILSTNRFNDKHLAAIVRVTGCKIICTKDKTSHKYLKDKRVYQGKGKVPSLYTRKEHSKLLCNKNIVNFCKPCFKLDKQERINFNNILKAV